MTPQFNGEALLVVGDMSGHSDGKSHALVSLLGEKALDNKISSGSLLEIS